MLEFCVLWVLVDSREACFFCLRVWWVLDRCRFGCPLGSMHCDMWRYSLLPGAYLCL